MIRVGILGTGFGAKHAAILSALPNVEIGGIFGRKQNKLDDICRSLNIPGVSDPDALFHDETST